MGPRRIVCLTEETTEWLYLLGEQERIVGISGYTVRPREARRDKTKVSHFLDGRIERIVALESDLVVGFSDMQAALAFAELAAQPMGRDRVIADPLEPARRRPDVIVGSWCGKKFRPERVAARPGWADTPAVRDGAVHEIKSADILQPGPAALTDGVEHLHRLFADWAAARG